MSQHDDDGDDGLHLIGEALTIPDYVLKKDRYFEQVSELDPLVKNCLLREYTRLALLKDRTKDWQSRRIGLLIDYVEWTIIKERYPKVDYTEALASLYVKSIILNNINYVKKRGNKPENIVSKETLSWMWESLVIIFKEIGSFDLNNTNLGKKIDLVQHHLDCLREGKFENTSRVLFDTQNILGMIIVPGTEVIANTVDDDAVPPLDPIDSSSPVDSSQEFDDHSRVDTNNEIAKNSDIQSEHESLSVSQLVQSNRALLSQSANNERPEEAISEDKDGTLLSFPVIDSSQEGPPFTRDADVSKAEQPISSSKATDKVPLQEDAGMVDSVISHGVEPKQTVDASLAYGSDSDVYMDATQDAEIQVNATQSSVIQFTPNVTVDTRYDGEITGEEPLLGESSSDIDSLISKITNPNLRRDISSIVDRLKDESLEKTPVDVRKLQKSIEEMNTLFSKLSDQKNEINQLAEHIPRLIELDKSVKLQLDANSSQEDNVTLFKRSLAQLEAKVKEEAQDRDASLKIVTGFLDRRLNLISSSIQPQLSKLNLVSAMESRVHEVDTTLQSISQAFKSLSEQFKTHATVLPSLVEKGTAFDVILQQLVHKGDRFEDFINNNPLAVHLDDQQLELQQLLVAISEIREKGRYYDSLYTQLSQRCGIVEQTIRNMEQQASSVSTQETTQRLNNITSAIEAQRNHFNHVLEQLKLLAIAVQKHKVGSFNFQTTVAKEISDAYKHTAAVEKDLLEFKESVDIASLTEKIEKLTEATTVLDYNQTSVQDQLLEENEMLRKKVSEMEKKLETQSDMVATTMNEMQEKMNVCFEAMRKSERTVQSYKTTLKSYETTFQDQEKRLKELRQEQNVTTQPVAEIVVPSRSSSPLFFPSSPSDAQPFSPKQSSPLGRAEVPSSSEPAMVVHSSSADTKRNNKRGRDPSSVDVSALKKVRLFTSYQTLSDSE